MRWVLSVCAVRRLTGRAVFPDPRAERWIALLCGIGRRFNSMDPDDRPGQAGIVNEIGELKPTTTRFEKNWM